MNVVKYSPVQVFCVGLYGAGGCLITFFIFPVIVLENKCQSNKVHMHVIFVNGIFIIYAIYPMRLIRRIVTLKKNGSKNNF